MGSWQYLTGTMIGGSPSAKLVKISESAMVMVAVDSISFENQQLELPTSLHYSRNQKLSCAFTMISIMNATIVLSRRKFRSQTSDNMDRWKAEVVRVKEEKRREEKRREEKRKRRRKPQKKEDADARKGRKVAKHSVFPMIWGSGGSKSRLAKAAGAEPAGQMRDEKLHADVARSTFRSQNVQSTHQLRTTFSSWDVEKVHAIVARSTFRSQNVKSTRGSDHFWTFRCAFAWQAQGIVDLVKSEQKVRVFEAFPKTMAGVGHVKRICKDAFSVANAIQETCLSEMLGGPGADFLREVAFWSIRSSGLLRWFCVTGAALRMTRYHFFVAGAVV